MERADYALWNSADVARLLALLESERRYYQEIVAGIPVGLLVVTSDLRVASANTAFRRIFNLRSADPFRGSLELLFPREILDRVREVLRSGHPQFGLRVTTRPDLGGRMLRIGIRPMTGWDLDNPREALLSIEDISDIQIATETAEEIRAAAEEVAQAAAEEAAAEPVTVVEVVESAAPEQPSAPAERGLINQLDAAIWAVELPEMRFIFASEGAVRLLGYPAEHWIENPNFWSERIAAEDRERLLALYIEAVAGDGRYSGEFRARTAEGRTVWLHESAHVVEGEGRRYIVGFSVDISGRREAESSRVTRERLDALKKLSGRLSHDLNNLLMIVTGYTEDALAGVGEGSPARSGLTAIRDAAMRLGAIAGQLRTFATYEPAEPGIVDLNAVVARLQEGIEAAHVSVQPAPEPVWARAEPAELEEALRGIVARAAASSSNGASAATVTVSRRGGFPSIEIRDNAPGVGADSMFEQVLGGTTPSEDAVSALARAFFAIEHWGGHISVEAANGGNLITIDLLQAERPAQQEQRHAEPHAEAAPAAPEASAEQEPPSAAPAAEEATAAETPGSEQAAPQAEPRREPRARTILVVEDEAGIRALVRKILERHGYVVLDTARAEEALGIVETNAIDLIITDLMMPEMNGQELVERLKSARPGLRVLFISGYTDDTSMYTREFGAGMAFLQKPFTLGALVGKVREVLGPAE
ncbi:MAG TPA: response regulator [Bryobacteraceae bacterium]|nr:response regulator [Bryobacteraceae bacterium]